MFTASGRMCRWGDQQRKVRRGVDAERVYGRLGVGLKVHLSSQTACSVRRGQACCSWCGFKGGKTGDREGWSLVQ